MSYTVNSITFDPEILDGSATEVILDDDDATGAISLPFTFNFYGTNFSQIYIGSNGDMAFSNPELLPNYQNGNIPIPEFGSSPLNSVLPFWQDLNPTATSGGGIGPELITNGSFTGNANGWSLGTGVSYNSNHIVFSPPISGDALRQDNIIVIYHQFFRLEFDLVVNSGEVQPDLIDSDTNVHALANPINTTGHQSIDFYFSTGYPSETISILFNTIDLDGTIDNVTLKQLARVGSIKYETFDTTPNRIFVVEYSTIPQYGNEAELLTTQVKFFEVNKNIEIHTTHASSVGNDNSGIVIQGVQNSNGTEAAFISGRELATDLTIDNDAVQFVPSAFTTTSTSSSSSSSSSSISTSTSSSSSSSHSTSSSTTLENIFIVGAEIGEVQALNANYSDDGVPIYFELETQEIEFSNRAHLKKIADEIVVLTEFGIDSSLECKPDDDDFQAIPMDLSNTVNIGKNINLEGNFFTFRWSGTSNKTSPIFNGIYLEKITDLGITHE